METSKPVHYTVALNFPRRIENTIGYSKAICKDMTGNIYFASSAAKLIVLKTLIDTLDTTETNFYLSPPTVTIEERNAALAKVKEMLHSLKADVQQAANASVKEAAIIIASSGMAIKRSTAHHKPVDSVTDGPVEGTVILKAAGRGPRDWRYSVDGIVWTNSSTRISRTKIANLIPGELYQFQNRPILTSEEDSKWSQIIKFRVR